MKLMWEEDHFSQGGSSQPVRAGADLQQSAAKPTFFPRNQPVEQSLSKPSWDGRLLRQALVAR